MRILYLVILSLTLASCKKSNETPSSISDYPTTTAADYDMDTDEISDGTYCAEVEYYNPNTGTRSTYDLDVEVENGELVQIDWPNGGWLDETYFSSEDISSGECSFTSDRGYQYTVTLDEKGGGCGGGHQLQSQVNQDTENTTCPKCGDEKDEYDHYCYSCKRKLEDEKQQQEDHERSESEEEY